MKKKLTLIIIILVIITAGISFYFFLQKEENRVDLFSDQRYSTEPTGFDLIQTDLDEGKLDFETALIYKVKYLFGDNTLPENYITEATPFEDDGTLADIQENWDSLSQETKDMLAPYFKRPDDPESFINQSYTASWGQEKTSFLKLIDRAYAYDRPVAYKTENAMVTTDGNIKVWYPVKIIMQDGEEKEIKLYYSTAQKIVSNLNKDGSYAQYIGLLGKTPPSDGTLGGDEKTDIYVATGAYVHLADSSGGTPSLGVNVPDNGSGSSSFIVIRENLDDKNLKTTTVHELFHAFQRAFGCTMSKSNWWWIEGTAVWAEDFIYPKENTEQGFVSNFIPKAEVILTKQGNDHEYGAYVFPFYLSKTYDRGVITKVFEGCNGSTVPLDSTEQNIDGGFKKNWKEFTLWNYNKKPVENYKNVDLSKTFPADSSESSGNSDMNFISGLGEAPYPTKELTALTAQVINYSLIDDSKEVRKMTFKNLKNFTDKTEKAAIKAIIYPKTGNPYTEDWTDKESRSFCLDKADENIDKVVLIFSNAELKNKIANTEIKIKNSSSCYDVDQAETMTVKPGFAVTEDYVGTLKYQAEGNLKKDSVPADAKYPYLGKWTINVNYFEQFPPQSLGGITATKLDFSYDHILEFDLSAESVIKDGTFEIQTKKGEFKTPGWDVNNEITGQTVNIPQNTTSWDVPQTGMITNMTKNGAKISLPDFVLYNSGGYRDLPHPIILEIKKD
ncbi:hypothetical protein KJ785_02520 [Patescibacteria group bacterium]|nr:hypothetical protein [Patescibacteria group bacterium]